MKHKLPLGSGLLLAAFVACQAQETGPVVPEGEFVVPQEKAVEVREADVVDEEAFLVNAFPPLLPESEPHRNAWLREDCLLCHETGVAGAPLLRHQGLPELVKQAKCRSCHLAADPDAAPLTNLRGEERTVFLADAFPPTLPSDESHSNAWMREDCLLCHKLGVGGAPRVRHTGMSEVLLSAKCRSCHLPSGRAEGL